MSQWIKCSGRMPEEGEDVIVCDNLRQVHEGYYLQYGDLVRWEIYSYKPSYCDEVTVTHWMPLPEPPQE